MLKSLILLFLISLLGCYHQSEDETESSSTFQKIKSDFHECFALGPLIAPNSEKRIENLPRMSVFINPDSSRIMDVLVPLEKYPKFQSSSQFMNALNHFYQAYSYRMAKHGMWVLGMQYPTEVDKMDSLSFQLLQLKKVSVEEARNALFFAMGIFLDELNHHLQLESYIPLDSLWENLLFGITFLDKNGDHPYEIDKITNVICVKGWLLYESFNPLTGKKKILFQETLWERIQKPSNSRYNDSENDMEALYEVLNKALYVCFSDLFEGVKIKVQIDRQEQNKL